MTRLTPEYFTTPAHPYKEYVELVREVVKGVRGGAVQPTYLVEPLIGMGWGALLLSLAPSLSLLVGGSLTLGVLDPRIGRSVDVGREETRELEESGAKVQTKREKHKSKKMKTKTVFLHFCGAFCLCLSDVLYLAWTL